MTKRSICAAVAALGLFAVGVAVAQGQPMPGHPMGRGAMAGCPGAGMGPGMGMGRGMGMGGGLGFPLGIPGVALKVEKLENGARFSVTSSDPKVAARIQKRAEITRLLYELQQEELASPQP